MRYSEMGREAPHKSATMRFRTDERDQLQRLIRKYQCSPFTGRCYNDTVSFFLDKKTGLYHMVLTKEQVEKFSIMEDFAVPEGHHQIMYMIKPTDEDKDYLVFRKAD